MENNKDFEHVIELLESEIDSLKDAYKKSERMYMPADHSVRIVEYKRAIKVLSAVKPDRDELEKIVFEAWKECTKRLCEAANYDFEGLFFPIEPKKWLEEYLQSSPKEPAKK